MWVRISQVDVNGDYVLGREYCLCRDTNMRMQRIWGVKEGIGTDY